MFRTYVQSEKVVQYVITYYLHFIIMLLLHRTHLQSYKSLRSNIDGAWQVANG